MLRTPPSASSDSAYRMPDVGDDALRTRAQQALSDHRAGGPDALLDAAITDLELLVARPDPGASDRQELAEASFLRWEVTGERDDLDRALTVAQALADDTAPSDPERPRVVLVLGMAAAAGAWADRSAPGLEQAIMVLEEALLLNDRLVAVNPRAAKVSSRDIKRNIAGAHHVLGSLRGDEAHLDHALRIYSDLPKDESDPRRLIRDLLEHYSTRADLWNLVHPPEEAQVPALRQLAQAMCQVIDALPADAPERVDAWTTLGNIYSNAFRLGESKEDIDAALDFLRRAVDDRSGSDAGRPDRLRTLASALHAASTARGEPGLLDEAESLLLEADRLASELGLANGAQQADLYLWLGVVHDAKADAASDSGARAALRDKAREAWQKAALAHESTPASFWAAVGWARSELAGDHFDDALAAFEVAADRAERAFRGLTSFDAKVLWTQARSGWPAEAAVAAARAGNPRRGVELLETSRALMLGERQRRRRVQLEHLRAIEHELADLFDQARALGDEIALDHLTERIRALPGFQGFLRNPSFADVAALAEKDPLVYVCASSSAGLALVLRDGEVTVVELPALVLDDQPSGLQARLDELRDVYESARVGGSSATIRRWAAVLDDFTGWIGLEVIPLLLPALGAATKATIISAGTLSVVPWHAAWVVDPAGPRGRRWSLDGIDLAHVPTASSLFGSDPPKPAGWSLAVCDPRPSKQRALPAASLEVDCTVSSLPGSRRLDGHAATRAGVLGAMRQADIVHLACHAQAVAAHPSTSHLIMAGDEPITVSELAVDEIRAQLITLSACETNVGSPTNADEALTLVHQLLGAGANATIGSMWLASDSATAAIMGRFYELWAREGLPAHRALPAAQRWFRDHEVDDIRRHIAELVSRDPAEVDLPNLDLGGLHHSNPVFWAPFVYAGR